MTDDHDPNVSPYLTKTVLLPLGARIRRLEEEANEMMERRLRFDRNGHPADRARYRFCLVRAVNLYSTAIALKRRF